MKTWRIQLSVPSGFSTPWHADTLFGHLCWTAERHDGFSGFKGAAGLIELYRNDTPPFILSDGFPGNWLPAPVTLRTLFEPTEAGSLNTVDYGMLKQAKKQEYLSLDQFRFFCRGTRFNLSSVAQKPLVNSVTLHNQIDRLSNTTGGSGGGLFEQPEQFVSDGCISIYAHISEGYEQDLKRLFELLAQGGFGKKRTTGKGAFRVTGFELFDGFTLPEGTTANGFVSLSHFVPAATDPTDGAWKVRVKYGKLGDEKTFCGNPFKKPLIMLQPGAVFRANNLKQWYGRLVEDIAFTAPDVVQYGYGFAAPVLQ